MTKLYEITDEMRDLQSMVDAGELTQDAIDDTMDALEAEQAKKIEACLKVRQQLLSDVEAFKAEMERIGKLKKLAEDNAQWLHDYVKRNLLATNTAKMDAGLFKVSLRKCPAKLGEVDEDKVPGKFWTVVPATKKLNRQALLKEAKETEINGVTIIDNEKSLVVR